MRIYVPGRGEVDLSLYRVAQAVNEYDERLDFERNPDTGQYCIYLKMPHGEPPLPILGFDDIPHPEDALKRLYQADTLRHGSEVYDRMVKKNEAIRAGFEQKASEGSEAGAEALEYLYRKLGSRHAPRVFFGGKRVSD